MNDSKVYVLNQGIQVRRENFGLLFYNYHGLRLYFVPIGVLIDPDFFDGNHTAEEMLNASCLRKYRSVQWIQKRMEQVLQLLEKKGLIHGKSIC